MRRLLGRRRMYTLRTRHFQPQLGNNNKFDDGQDEAYLSYSITRQNCSYWISFFISFRPTWNQDFWHLRFKMKFKLTKTGFASLVNVLLFFVLQQVLDDRARKNFWDEVENRFKLYGSTGSQTKDVVKKGVSNSNPISKTLFLKMCCCAHRRQLYCYLVFTRQNISGDNKYSILNTLTLFLQMDFTFQFTSICLILLHFKAKPMLVN